MEVLKQLEEVLEPDGRQKLFAVIDHSSGEYRPLMLQDIYRSVASIKLHNGVPEEIRSHFATAQNLLVYSWFFYPFNVTAQFLAFATVELALKIRLKPKRKASFKSLVRSAIEQGLVNDQGFSHIQYLDLNDFPGEEIAVMPKQTKSYVEILADSMPYLRNELAHGSPMLHPNGASSVRICAEFINQLFLEKSRH